MLRDRASFNGTARRMAAARFHTGIGGALKEWLERAADAALDVPETCALDVAERGGATLEIASYLGIIGERARLIEACALAELFRRAPGRERYPMSAPRLRLDHADADRYGLVAEHMVGAHAPAPDPGWSRIQPRQSRAEAPPFTRRRSRRHLARRPSRRVPWPWWAWTGTRG
jgi:hypothetical protein